MTVPVTRKLPKLRKSDLDPLGFIKRGWMGCVADTIPITERKPVVYDVDSGRYVYKEGTPTVRLEQVIVFLRCASKTATYFLFDILTDTVFPTYNTVRERAGLPWWISHRHTHRRVRLYRDDKINFVVVDPLSVPIDRMLSAAKSYGLLQAKRKAAKEANYRFF